jgi:hypothetical protein
LGTIFPEKAHHMGNVVMRRKSYLYKYFNTYSTSVNVEPHSAGISEDVGRIGHIPGTGDFKLYLISYTRVSAQAKCLTYYIIIYLFVKRIDYEKLK